jgi:D-tagatose-1,6-bisphosphate aldolase subunit GatZ/KbaZ
MTALAEFTAGLDRNRSGKGGVAVSICSAHPLVLRALFRSAKQYDTFALVESTSNQVDQYGGYTGMRPADFVRLVHDLAEDEGFPKERVLLGGDHLGPNTWRAKPAADAMTETMRLVEAYVKAGYRKIHLDASFVCAGDPTPLTDEIVAARSAEMAKVCEAASDGARPIYVVGTEVPTPGGVYADEAMHITTPADVEQTLSVFRDTFRRNGLQSAWERVVGIVVQPGVEFGDGQVHDFRPVPELASTILQHPGMIFEAHSTDYQTPANLQRLVASHFFILKVGPWLTYALREGAFLLELVERELRPAAPSNLRATIMTVMKQDPKYWSKYYTGTPAEVDFKLAFSYSDRSRYYLGRKEIEASFNRLFANLASQIPETLLSQYLPAQYAAVREGSLGNAPRDLVIDRIRNVIDLYLRAGAGA